MSDSQRDRDRLLRGVMWAVFLWGSLLALGAGLMGVNPESGAVEYAPNPVRGLIVLASVTAFVLLWRVLLASRTRHS